METQTTQPQTATAAPVIYASFLERLVAGLIDGIIVGIAGGVITSVLGQDSSLGSLLSAALSWGYFVGMTVKYGATVGKKAMNLRVQNQTTGKNLTLIEAILREIVGKFLSAIALLLGYFWMLWDPNKQTWHDKLGKSFVVKVTR